MKKRCTSKIGSRRKTLVFDLIDSEDQSLIKTKDVGSIFKIIYK